MDYGHEQTDRELKKLERRLAHEYKTARDSVEKKFKKQFEQFSDLDAKYAKMVEDGKMSEKDYKRWRQSAMMRTKGWEDLRDTLASDLSHTNEIAMGMINDHAIDCYALNMNYGTYEIENGYHIGTSFSMYDHRTVENLMKDDPQIIPKAGLDVPKDERWNRQKLTSAITQGILTGDSIPDIAKRLGSVAKMNEHAAVRNARTYTTAAENKGRVDSYERAQNMGIDLEQEWVATLDMRTRSSHRHLDGERVKIGAKFSNKCRYPGDPEGKPEEIYNCRCTLVAALKGYDYQDDRFSRLPKDMTYEEWKTAKDRKAKPANNVVNGRDLSGTWVRRPDQFDFEIEDIINAQGFDGLPRVVSPKEFEEAVRLANGGSGFIAQRSYSAPNGDILNEYQENLYNGKWYVDCSVGGSTEGQGMYCAASYDGKLNNYITHEMDAYSNSGKKYAYEAMSDDEFYGLSEKVYAEKVKWYKEQLSKGMPQEEASYIINSTKDEEFAEKYAPELLKYFPQSKVETLTLDPSAKVITEKELIKLKNNDDPSFKNMDNGVYAALKGYDAINAEGKGTSGEVSYTVILNRTKVIFKGE